MDHNAVVDANKDLLIVGSRVRCFGYVAETHLVDEWYGVITGITEADGDTDDHGRTIGINPMVTVKFDDETEDAFTTTWMATGPWNDDAPFQCSDIELVPR